MASDQDWDMDNDRPIEELKDHVIEPHPELGGRVRRSINRRSLAADTLDLSLNILPRTIWAYLQTILESLPGIHRQEEE